MTDTLVRLDPVTAPPPPVTPAEATSRPAITMACLSASAGVIHAALAPSHMSEWALEGIGFAVVAWVQLGLGAGLLLRRRSLTVLQGTILANLAALAAWAVSRTTGFPFGPHAGHPEAFSFVDEVCVAIEVVLVLAAFATLVGRRRFKRILHGGTFAFAVPLVTVALTSAALLSPSARNHAHDAHGAHAAGHVHGSADDKGFSLLHNGHHAAIASYALDPASQKALDAQLAITRDVARRYPTVAAAEAAGYRRAGPYSPGLGAHYVLVSAEALDADGMLDAADIAHPLSIQYDGTSPTSRVAGFMYYSMSAVEPQGFVGRNDVWHIHTDLCLKYGPNGVEAPFGADKAATKAQCDAVGGTITKQTQWMVHVWSVPGYSNPDGVFGEMNPHLRCSDGTYYELPPGQWATHLQNICRSAA
jgi:hypothetical protein